ncbi:MAG: HNH endonuclease family protein [bacterium]
MGLEIRRRVHALLSVLCLMLPVAEGALAETVKQSASGICHDADSPWYERTRRFTPYPDIESCLVSGRPYEGYEASATGPDDETREDLRATYQRRLYGRWADLDADCLDTRHEVLRALATGPVTMSEDGCQVLRGRWNDPYTGRIHRNARDLDIDHLVPLAWAHARGGYAWSEEKRRRFANDPVNLFAVRASVNRSKAARGPLDWLPPNPVFHCTYVIRFHRIVRIYGLQYRPGERSDHARLRERLCGEGKSARQAGF